MITARIAAAAILSAIVPIALDARPIVVVAVVGAAVVARVRTAN